MSGSSNKMGFRRHLLEEGSHMDKPVHQQSNHAALPLYVTLILDERGSTQS